MIKSGRAQELVSLARAAGKWPDEALTLPLGRYVINQALVRAAREEWREAVEKKLPSVPRERMGYELLEPLLTLLVKETG